MELYQSLVTVNPVTLIAQILNLFLQLFLVKKFFLDKIRAVLDQRRAAADREITDARAAREDAMSLKETYEQNMRLARSQADQIVSVARRTAAALGEEIISQARQQAAEIRQNAASDIAMEKKKALFDIKNQISDISVLIAGKVLGRELTAADQSGLVDSFIDGLGGST